MKKKLAVMALAAATLSMMAMPVYADDLVTVGYAQVGHESDWRTANTQNYQDVFSEDACLLYTSPSPRDMRRARMPSSA